MALLLPAAWAFSADAGLQGLERVRVSGADYVRLGEWADSNKLKMIWRPKEGPVIELTNASARLRLEADSRRSQISGATVWLSLPVVNRNGVAMISEADLENTVQPVLFPEKSRARVETVCLDAGHGGKDKGEVDGTNYEKKYTLLLAKAVEKLLLAAGFKVILTRADDTFIELPERPALAARAEADLFVSLHYNSGPRGVRGVEVHCMTPAGMNSSNEGSGRGEHPADTGNADDARNILLACEVLKSITGALPVDEIGVKRSRYEVLRMARMPAILVEGGFMTDPQDRKQIYDADFRQRMARAIVAGIQAYKEAVETKPEAAEVKPSAAAVKPETRN